MYFICVIIFTDMLVHRKISGNFSTPNYFTYGGGSELVRGVCGKGKLFTCVLFELPEHFHQQHIFIRYRHAMN